MKIVQFSEIRWHLGTRKMVKNAIMDGKVFVYPTDTVYGLGCNAMNRKAVKRIREIKNTGHPFSVIAPSKRWITDNLEMRYPKYLDRLPGPYTLIMNMKNNVVSREVSRRTLGVRIPDHPFTEVVQEVGIPFVTTSANMSGEVPVWTTQGIPEFMEEKIDLAVHEDILNNPPSTVIDLSGPRPKILR